MLGGVSRPLRLEHPGAVWHVTSRGNERREVFADDADRERWLRVLAQAVVLFAWRLHGYVMMGNHFHLIVETPPPTLSRGMRHLNGVYTQLFNRRRDRVGHLFQGRFKSILVEKESHLLELLRYVVLNPVRAGLVRSAQDWRWSSYRATAGDVAAPPWLETAWSLAQFGPLPGAARRYREFVAAGGDVPRDAWSGLRGQIYLGSEAFVEGALERAAASTRDPEIPRPQRETAPEVGALRSAVLEALAISDRDLADHPRKLARERALMAYALRRFAGATGATMARTLGVTPWHASALARAGEAQWEGDAELARRMEEWLRRRRGVDRKSQT